MICRNLELEMILPRHPRPGGEAESPGERGSAATGLSDLPGDCGDRQDLLEKVKGLIGRDSGRRG